MIACSRPEAALGFTEICEVFLTQSIKKWNLDMTRVSSIVNLIVLILLAILPVSRGVASDGVASIELKDCEEKAPCVSMLLDIKPGDSSAVIVSSQDKETVEDANGYTVFKIRFQGILSGKTQTIEATFKGYTAGIDCTSFGQGTIGFLGYSATGSPIIASSAGPIEVIDKRLEVGCEHCLVLHDAKTGKVIGTFRSPGYDLTLTDVGPSDFSYDLPGGYNVKQGAMCLRVQDSGPVQSVYPERCIAPKKPVLEVMQGDCS